MGLQHWCLFQRGNYRKKNKHSQADLKASACSIRMLQGQGVCAHVRACIHACGHPWVCRLKIRAAQWKDVISQAWADRGWASQGGPSLAPRPAHEVRQRPGVRARECRQGLLAKGQGVWGQDSEGQSAWGSHLGRQGFTASLMDLAWGLCA